MTKSNSDEYKDFLKMYIPKSYFINSMTKNIYSRITENLVVTEIFKNYINECELECYIEFLENYKNKYNKLLLYLGINDYESVTYCIRSLIENLLKFIYSIYIIELKENIEMFSYRNIKDELIEFSKNGLEINMELISKLFSIYGEYSKVIHGKENTKVSIEYIVDIIENKNDKLNNIDQILLKIINIYEDIMIDILKIEYLSTSDLINLKKMLSKKRFDRFQNSIKA